MENIVQEMKQVEEEFIKDQQLQMENYISNIKHQPPTKIKYSSKILEKRKYLSSLIKVRNYKVAEEVK